MPIYAKTSAGTGQKIKSKTKPVLSKNQTCFIGTVTRDPLRIEPVVEQEVARTKEGACCYVGRDEERGTNHTRLSAEKCQSEAEANKTRSAAAAGEPQGSKKWGAGRRREERPNGYSSDREEGRRPCSYHDTERSEWRGRCGQGRTNSDFPSLSDEKHQFGNRGILQQSAITDPSRGQKNFLTCSNINQLTEAHIG